MHVAPSWEYVPVAPYRVLATTLGTALDGAHHPPPHVEWRPTLVDALQLFDCTRVTVCREMERSVIVTDFNDITVLAYANSRRWFSHWIGTAAAFEALRDANVTLEPIEVDLAEIEAHAAWSTDG